MYAQSYVHHYCELFNLPYLSTFYIHFDMWFHNVPFIHYHLGIAPCPLPKKVLMGYTYILAYHIIETYYSKCVVIYTRTYTILDLICLV